MSNRVTELRRGEGGVTGGEEVTSPGSEEVEEMREGGLICGAAVEPENHRHGV